MRVGMGGIMWSLEARSALARAVAGAFYLAAVALLVLVQELGLWLRREENRAWWAGNGRDLLNAGGLTAVTASLRAYGFPIAAALIVSATLTLALIGTSIFMETRMRVARPRAWALTVGLAFAAPVLLFPAEVLGTFARAAGTLFPFRG
jgi:hypothetical protein